MTPADRIEEAIAVRGKATPGPWAVHPQKAVIDAFNTGLPVSVCGMLWPTTERTEEETEANATIISAAPDLVDEVVRLRAEVARLQAQQQAKDCAG